MAVESNRRVNRSQNKDSGCSRSSVLRMDKKPQTVQDARIAMVVDGEKGNLMFSALRSDRLERQPDIHSIHRRSIAFNIDSREHYRTARMTYKTLQSPPSLPLQPIPDRHTTTTVEPSVPSTARSLRCHYIGAISNPGSSSISTFAGNEED